jgi:hypothetical protein
MTGFQQHQVYAESVNASVNASVKKVLQINASLTINHQQEFVNAPFILIEGEPSTLAEEGLGGYKVEMIAHRNTDGSYTVQNKVYNYTKSGYNLLGIRPLTLLPHRVEQFEFESTSAGPVLLSAEIVQQAEFNADDQFGQAIR